MSGNSEMASNLKRVESILNMIAKGRAAPDRQATEALSRMSGLSRMAFNATLI